MKSMPALTIRQPWLWCITHADKRVENRTWKPPRNLLGQRLALHSSAALRLDEYNSGLRVFGNGDAKTMMQMIRARNAGEMALGAIVATAQLRGFVSVHETGFVESVGDVADYNPHHDRWFFGPIGWVLDDVQLLPAPIKCRGQLGVWASPLPTGGGS